MTTTERQPLTPPQLRAYRCVVAWYRDTGCYPTIRDLCGALGISSPNGVLCHLKALDKKGWLVWKPTRQDGDTPAQSRGVRVPELQEAAMAAATKLLNG